MMPIMINSPVQPSTSHLAHPKYRPDIDGLRAIAILAVVGFHAFPNWIRGGFIGVDIFFVISGYLISTIIMGCLDRNSFSFIEFYVRRINRIFPALLLVLITCLVFGWFALSANEYKQLGKHIAGGAGFISNYLFWGESGYFDNAAQTKPLLHLWSLAIEEQFYIVWPILLWFVWKQKFNIFTVTLLFGFISLTLNVVKINDGHFVDAFYLPQMRFWELLIGSVLAYITLHHQNLFASTEYQLDLLLGKIIYANAPEVNGKTLRNVQSLLGAAFFAIGFALITKEGQFPGWWALLPTLGTVLIISAGTQAWVNRVVLSNRVLVWIGLISFPLYLWHWPVLSFVRILESEAPSWKIRIVAIFLSTVLAWLTYKLIEAPIRLSGHNKWKAFALVALMTLLGLVGYICYQKDGIPSRNPKIEQQLIQFEWDKTYNFDAACKQKYGNNIYCNITDINSSPSAALIGDSHANQFYPGLSAYYKKKGANLLNVGAGGCPPLFEFDMGKDTRHFDLLGCYSRTKAIYDYVLNEVQIKTVYISFHHSFYFENEFKFIDKLNQPLDNDNYKNVVNGLIRTIKMLESKGKTVVLIYDMPTFSKNIKSCFNVRLIYQNKSCNLSSSMFIDDFSKYNLLVSEITKNTSIKVFYTHQFIEGNFPVDQNGIPTYRDEDHLSLHGSMFFSDKFTF
jgi:peptidoglycan/LPS O-acetylase OafA/YrhL